ncbi:MAG TPA: spermidine/putrescine ABC transporter substrate-binding protein [Actinomycetota bacterium]|jgi:spermidine/putrescine transport system substrate-binding protein
MADRSDPARDARRDTPITDPALLRGLTQRRLSRRDLLRYGGFGAGALSLGAILAACGGQPGGGAGGGGGGTTGGGGGASVEPGLFDGEPNGVLNFANWPLYIDKKKVSGETTYPSLERFTADTGIQVNYREVINSNPEFFGKIQPQLAAGQSTGYDIIVITNGDTLNQLIRLNYLIELPADKHPNFDANANPAIKDPSYDPGNKFTMAWQSGMTGIGWDPAQVAELRPSKPEITSIMDLFDPVFAGKVGMFADNADQPCLVMIGMGINPETSTPDDWQAAADLLQKQKDDGIVRQYYTQNYTNALQNGDVALTIGWSGDIYQLNAEGDASGLQFCIPEEGIVVWTDNMCIPVGVENPVDAITYMDYVYDPEIAGMIASWVNYFTPVPAAADYVDPPELADSNLIFPTEEDLANTYSYYVFKNPEEQQQWNSLFQPIYQS